jgi:hypothetical protein
MRVATATALALCAGAASAEEPAEPPPAAEPAPVAEPARALEAAPACPPEAQALYETAFDLFTTGDNAAAQLSFMEATKKCPQHPHAAEMARLAAARAAKAPVEERMAPEPAVSRDRPPEPPAPPDLRGPESTTMLARGELVAVQTLHGVGQGILGCIMLQCTDPRAVVGMAVLGAAAGAAGSFVLTLDGIKPGGALAVNSGTGWGFWEGLALSQILNISDSRLMSASMASGAAVGTAIGVLVALEIRPTDGQVAIANTGGIWAGIIGLWSLFASRTTFNTQTTFLALIAASNLGLAAFGTLGAFFPVSRGRMFLVDAGGILGMLLGMGVAVLAAGGSSPDQTAMGVLASIGIVAGTGAAALITHGIDYPNAPLFALAPLGPNGTPGLTAAVAW